MAITVRNEGSVRSAAAVLIALLLALLLMAVSAVMGRDAAGQEGAKEIIIRLNYTDSYTADATPATTGFTVNDSEFARQLNQSNLCTRWGVYSVENGTAQYLCYGSESCCSLLGLPSGSEQWNDAFSLELGRYGATINSAVSAQISYNYGFSNETSYMEVYYSDASSLPAMFVMPSEPVPAEPMLPETGDEPAKPSNNIPVCNIPNQSIQKNSSASLSLNSYCTDADGDRLQFSFESNESLLVTIVTAAEASTATLAPVPDFVGQMEMTFTANDSVNVSQPNRVNITVAGEAGPSANATAATGVSVTEVLVQDAAEVGKPVKWTKRLLLTRSGNASTKIPGEAKNIVVKKWNDTDIGNKARVIQGGMATALQEYETAQSGSQGTAAAQAAQPMPPLQGEDITEYVTVVIEENATEYEIEYLTPAPEKTETPLGRGSRVKQVTVFSEASVHYYNVRAYTDIPETKAVQAALRLYKITGGSRVDVSSDSSYNVTFADADSNGLYDRMEWVVPQLSEEVFEVGLATVNTRKSVYHPGEAAEIVVVVLDDKGRLASNAEVAITVTSPDNRTTKLTTAAGAVNETERGIYEASYSATEEEGNYTLLVSAAGNNANSEMASYFTVQGYYEFDILRSAPVTTDPWKGPFASAIKIVSLTNAATFDFAEYLPGSFTITDPGGATVAEESGLKLLTWKGLANNSAVAYSALPPLKTPELYALGPSKITYGSGGSEFTEARPWLLAVDPAGSGKRQQKTVEYFIFMNWSQITNTAAATPYREDSLINVYIPETSPVLKSAWVDMYFGKSGVGTVLGGNSGLSVNGSSTWAFGRAGANTGEYLLMNYLANVTSRLSALGFSTGPNNYNFSFNITLNNVAGVINAPSAKLYLTYEYDDASAEQLYAVKRFIGQLNESTGIFGTGGTDRRQSANFTLPNMSRGLPPSAVVRDAWIELYGVVGADTTTDARINVTLDNEAYGNNNENLIDLAGGGPASFRLMHKPSGFNPNLPHTLNVSLSGGANNLTGLSAELTMTYSYDTTADSGRLETVRYYIDQNDSSFTAAGATQGRGAVISLPQNKLTVQDAYVVVTGHLGVATTAATDASRKITLAVSRPGISEDTAGYNVNLRHSAVDASQNIMSFRLLYNATTLQGLSNGDTVNCTVAVDGSGMSSPGCELIITYNYSYPDSPNLVKTVGFFAGSSGREQGSAGGPIAATANNLTANFSITYPGDEGTITILSPYFWVTNPNFATTAANSIFRQNLSKSDESAQTLTINNPDLEQFFAWGNYNATGLINTTADAFLLGMGSPTASTYNAWAWVTYAYTVDREAPNTTIIIPEREANVTGNLLINVSVNESISSVLSVNATFHNSTGNATGRIPMSLGAGTLTSGYWNATFDTTTLPDGRYNITVNATDEVANTNITANLSILVDNTFPVFTAINATPNPANHSLNNVEVNWTVNETNLYVNFTNVTYPNGTVLGTFTSNFTLTPQMLPAVGNYTLLFFANDTTGHVNMTLLNLTVDDVMPPFITPVAPANMSSLNNETVAFKYNVSDASPVANCTLDLNSGQAKADNQSLVNMTGTNNITTALADGYYNWTIQCFDYLNLSNYSTNWTLTIDTIKPNLTYILPTPQDSQNINTTLIVNITHNETNPGTIRLLIDGAASQQRGYAPGPDTFTNFTAPLPDGTYNFSVFLNDTAGNNDTLPNRTVTIDTARPVLIYAEPTPIDNYNQSQTSLVINITHNDTNPDTVNLTINNAVNQSQAYGKAFNFTNFTLADVNEGLYTYYAFVNDTAGNTNQTETRTVRVDFTAPLLNIESPGPVNYTNNPLANFTYTVTDNVAGVKNCTLLVNSQTNQTDTIIQQGVSQNFTLQLENGTYSWRTGCYDYADNLNMSGLGNVTVDTTTPEISAEAVNTTETSINRRVCINATATDTFSNISEVLAEVSKPLSGLTNVTLTNTSSCGNAGGAVYALQFVNNEEGNYTWNRTYARDKAGNLNWSVPPIPVNWSATSQIFLNATMLQPLLNVTINESPQSQNYSFVQDCNTVCRQGSAEDCQEAYLKPQLNNGSWRDITNVSGQLISNLSPYYCGTIAIGAACNASFSIRTSSDSGGNDFPLRCLANSTNAPIDVSIGINVTVNGHPVAAFTKPGNLENISGSYRLNASASTDDRGMANYTFELDNNAGFATPTPLCSSTDANCTLDTISQAECSEGNFDCYIRVNATDIYGLDNATTVRVQVDNTKPTVKLNSPANNSYIGAAPLTLNYTPTDLNIGACTLYHNGTGTPPGWQANQTNYSVTSGSATTFDITLADDSYLWNVLCNDTAGNIAFNTTNFTFTADTTPPNITFISGTEANDTYFSRGWIFVNVTVNDTNVANITFRLYNTTHLANETNATGGPSGGGQSNASANFTGINPNMEYWYNVTAMDKAGRGNITETRKITLDTMPPNITFSSGTEANDTYFSRGWIFVNATVNETNFNNISFYLYDSLFNLVNLTNFTSLNLSLNFTGLTDTNERYYYNVTARDNASNENSTLARAITLDDTIPLVKLNEPENNSLTLTNLMPFNYTPTDTNLMNCSLYANFSGTFELNTTNSTTLSSGSKNTLQPQQINDGNYIWNVLCYDKAGNYAFNSTNYTLTIDATPPMQFNLSLPANSTQSANVTPTFEWNTTNETHFTNYTLLADNDSDFSSPYIAIYIFNMTNASHDLEAANALSNNTIYYWLLTAYDNLSQAANSSQTFTYITDNTTPQTDLIAPAANYSETSSNVISFTYNATDLNDLATCSLILNDQEVASHPGPQKDTPLTFARAVSNGGYNWSVNCTDSAGNFNISETRNLSVEVPTPRQPFDMIAYNVSSGSGGFPKYRAYAASFDAQADANDSQAATTTWLVTKSNPVRDELLMGTLDTTGDITMQVYNSTAWKMTGELAQGISTTEDNYKGFDIEFEQLSGRGLAVYNTGQAGMENYSVWNSTDWEINGTLPSDSCAGTPRWIRLAAKNGTNNIAAMYIDSAADYCAAIWNGSDWINSTLLAATTTGSATERFDIAYESSSGDILAVWESSTGGIIQYCEYNSTNLTWCAGPSALGDRGTANTWIQLASEPESDRIMMGAFQTAANNDFETLEWSGTAFGTWRSHDLNAEPADRVFGVAYIGNTGNAIAVWVSATNDFTNYSTCSGSGCGTGTWANGGNTTLTTDNCGEAANLEFVQVDADTHSNRTMATAHSVTTHFVCAQEYDGDSSIWGSWNSNLGSSGTAILAGEQKMFAYNRFADTQAPLVSFVPPSPENNSLLNSSTVTINMSANDSYDIFRCRLEWQGVNETMSMAKEGSTTYCYAAKTGLTDGNYSFRAYANDTSANMNSTPLVNITIDLTAPSITVNMTPNPANYSLNNVTVNWSATDLYINTSYANATYPNGTPLGNFSSSFNLTTANLTVPGNYTLLFFANDTAGNYLGITEYLFVNDTEFPLVILNAPQNNSYNSTNDIRLYYTPSDNYNVTNCTLIINSEVNTTNSTIAQGIQNNVSLYFNEGNYTWLVNCSDTLNNINVSETRLFTVDTMQPNITYSLITEVNNSNTSNDWIFVNVTANDTNELNITFYLFNDTGLVNETGFTDSTREFNFTTLQSDGFHYYNVTIIDKALNRNTTETRLITIVRGPAEINVSLDSDNASVIINWTNKTYADYFDVYISLNSTGFREVPNASGIVDRNWTDQNASQAAARFYKVASVRGSANKTSNFTEGKHTIFLAPYWNMVTFPLAIRTLGLKNSTNPEGYDFAVSPPACLGEVWRYNATLPDPWEYVSYESGQWTPATGDDNFTSIEPGRGYWLYNNLAQSCNLTFAGVVPTGNTSRFLNASFNLQSWYSEDNPPLPTSCQPPYPVALSQPNSVTTLYYYNTTTLTFKGTMHYTSASCGGNNDWGWWPDSRSGEFRSLNPGRSYYFKASKMTNWTLQSST